MGVPLHCSLALVPLSDVPLTAWTPELRPALSFTLPSAGRKPPRRTPQPTGSTSLTSTRQRKRHRMHSATEGSCWASRRLRPTPMRRPPSMGSGWSTTPTWRRPTSGRWRLTSTPCRTTAPNATTYPRRGALKSQRNSGGEPSREQPLGRHPSVRPSPTKALPPERISGTCPRLFSLLT